MNAQALGLTPIPDPDPRLGIFTDEPAEAYYVRRLDEASNSGLKVIDEQSPAHYLYWAEHPDDDAETEALAFGKAYHMATLEPERFGDSYTVLPADAPRDLRYLRGAAKPSDATKAAIDWWDSWEAHNAGRVMLTDSSYSLARAMADSQRRLVIELGPLRITLAELIDACAKEVTVRWIDEETGILCKLRADLWSQELRFAGDLKSCLDAGKEAFGRAIHSRRYHVQDTHYSEGFRAVGEPLSNFALLPVEKKRPHVPASWIVDAPSAERGWAIRQRSMRKLKACLDAGTWPGYTTTLAPIGIPAYGHYDQEATA